METRTPTIHELTAAARKCSTTAIRDAEQELTNGGGAAELLSAMMNLMRYCEEENGFGCRACESLPRAWKCIWILLGPVEYTGGMISRGTNPYRRVIENPNAWPYLAKLLDWVKRFEGSFGEKTVWDCPSCGFRIDGAKGILDLRQREHRTMHRTAIEGAVVGMAAGDSKGLVTQLLLRMVDARGTSEPSQSEGAAEQYAQWLSEIPFERVQAGFLPSGDSSVGACVATVIALDPGVPDLATATKVAGDVAELLGCGPDGIDAAQAALLSCRIQIQQARIYPRSQFAGKEKELLGHIKSSIRLAATGTMPDGVQNLHSRPAAVRTEVLQDRSDQALSVLIAAKHFTEISMHCHTALQRVFGWAEGPHPAGVIAGFWCGARYGASLEALERFFSAATGVRSEISRVAEMLGGAWDSRFMLAIHGPSN